MDESIIVIISIIFLLGCAWVVGSVVITFFKWLFVGNSTTSTTESKTAPLLDNNVIINAIPKPSSYNVGEKLLYEIKNVNISDIALTAVLETLIVTAENGLSFVKKYPNLESSVTPTIERDLHNTLKLVNSYKILVDLPIQNEETLKQQELIRAKLTNIQKSFANIYASVIETIQNDINKTIQVVDRNIETDEIYDNKSKLKF